MLFRKFCHLFYNGYKKKYEIFKKKIIIKFFIITKHPISDGRL